MPSMNVIGIHGQLIYNVWFQLFCSELISFRSSNASVTLHAQEKHSKRFENLTCYEKKNRLCLQQFFCVCVWLFLGS